MTLSTDIRDRELNKFRDSNFPNTKVAVSIEQSPSSPIPVSVSSALPTGQDYLYDFQDASSVASGSETLIFTKTITDAEYYIDKIDVSGSNKAVYNIYIDSVLVNRKRTYFTYLNESFNFGSLRLITSQLIEVKVTHDGPSTGDFNAVLIGIKTL